MNYSRLLFIVTIMSLHIANAAGLKLIGKVDKVLKSSVRISVSSIEKVSTNDKVVIYHKMSSGTKIKIGEWKVLKRDKTSVYATPTNIIQDARVGQFVEIFTSKNMTTKRVEKKEPIKILRHSYDSPTDPVKQNALGWNYQQGINGVKKDLTKAVYWYRKGAEQGYSLSQDNMGWMYKNGLGVKKDLKEAYRWFYKSAHNGHINGQNNLGIAYQNGYGITKDYKKAVYWYMKSANAGKVSAQSNLGYMYLRGLGTKQDYKKSFYWFEKAANKGNVIAQSHLGVLYYYGTGVEKNIKKAIELFKKSARSGNKVSQNNLKNLGIKW